MHAPEMRPPFRLLVTGSRTWDDIATIGQALAVIVARHPEGVLLVHGGHGWPVQVPARQAIERDDAAVAVWKAEVWPDIKAPRATWAPGSASRTRQARG